MPADTPALNRKVASDAVRNLGFSDADDFEDAFENDEFDEQTVVNRVHIKDQPPKFNGKTKDFMSWSQEFKGFAVHWSFSNALHAKRELDVSDPRMCERD